MAEHALPPDRWQRTRFTQMQLCGVGKPGRQQLAPKPGSRDMRDPRSWRRSRQRPGRAFQIKVPVRRAVEAASHVDYILAAKAVPGDAGGEGGAEGERSRR